MRRHWIVLLAVFMIVCISGCTSTDMDSENKTKTFTQNNISFEYPSGWVVATSLANDTVAAVADPSSVDSSGLAQISVVIQVKELKGNLYDMYKVNYDVLFSNSSYQRISESNITMNNRQVIENIYTASEGGVQKKKRAIWIQNGNKVYVILCSAPVTVFDREKENFDLIVNSFRFV